MCTLEDVRRCCCCCCCRWNCSWHCWRNKVSGDQVVWAASLCKLVYILRLLWNVSYVKISERRWNDKAIASTTTANPTCSLRQCTNHFQRLYFENTKPYRYQYRRFDWNLRIKRENWKKKKICREEKRKQYSHGVVVASRKEIQNVLAIVIFPQFHSTFLSFCWNLNKAIYLIIKFNKIFRSFQFSDHFIGLRSLFFPCFWSCWENDRLKEVAYCCVLLEST